MAQLPRWSAVVILTVLATQGTDVANANHTAPIVINTWGFKEATREAWRTLLKGGSSLDAIEEGCSRCEDLQCDGTVGYGGSPDENGETTLDALIMFGPTRNVGAVAQLRRIKSAMRVARKVLEHTKHTLLAGDLATDFAKSMGFQETSLTTDKSTTIYEQWKNNSCQPNYWLNVRPNPRTSCGPYRPLEPQTARQRWTENGDSKSSAAENRPEVSRWNHDTIGMVAIDSKLIVSAGTSTNGASHKIPGRVGDSPIPGAGAYADQEVGGAAATGDGDIMMRFLPSYQAVEYMRQGHEPARACQEAMHRITRIVPSFQGGLVCLNISGAIGAACHGLPSFPFSHVSDKTGGKVVVEHVPCEHST